MTKQKPQKQPLEIDKLNEQVAELDQKWKRALADYQNLEKRTHTDRQTFVKIANLSLIAHLLPVIDDLERATQHLKDQGLEMILKQLMTVLKNEGVMEIDANGKEFDPNLMECVEKQEGEENVVVEVTTKGFTLHDMIIRPAKVVVGSKKE
jgi:molecular chaperone GrpE